MGEDVPLKSQDTLPSIMLNLMATFPQIITPPSPHTRLHLHLTPPAIREEPQHHQQEVRHFLLLIKHHDRELSSECHREMKTLFPPRLVDTYD